MNRGRPRKFDEHQALQAAMEVFWEKGFDGASCEDLLSAMKINAGSMYAAFGDKQALYEKALDLYCDRVFTGLGDILRQPGSPLEAVRSLIRTVADHMASPESKGCLIGNTIIEFGADLSPLAQMARDRVLELQAALEEKLADAKTQGELRSTSDPRELACFLVNTIQGLNVMARMKASPETIRSIARTTLAALA